jgi:hypothetical protein
MSNGTPRQCNEIFEHFGMGFALRWTTRSDFNQVQMWRLSIDELQRGFFPVVKRMGNTCAKYFVAIS